MIVNNRIAGTRITVWDVLHYSKPGGPGPRLPRPCTSAMHKSTPSRRYIAEHQEELRAVHQQIEARKARGNPPEITAKLAKSRTKLQEWLTQHHETKDVGCPCM